MRLILSLFRKFRRWQCQRAFDRLPYHDKQMLLYLELDPQSKIHRGEL